MRYKLLSVIYFSIPQPSQARSYSSHLERLKLGSTKLVITNSSDPQESFGMTKEISAAGRRDLPAEAAWTIKDKFKFLYKDGKRVYAQNTGHLC